MAEPESGVDPEKIFLIGSPVVWGDKVVLPRDVCLRDAGNRKEWGRTYEVSCSHLRFNELLLLEFSFFQTSTLTSC